jgi:hypothetical protein
MTPRERDDFVCEKLGLWKRGQICSCTTFKGMIAKGVYRCVKCGFTFNGTPNDPVSRKHESPPPDLRTYEGMGRLIEALAGERGWTSCLGPAFVIVHDSHGDNLGESMVSDDHGYPDGLADAAYEAPKEK